jgi:RNA polymerase sigma-70 factor (sigma-E family)
MQSRDGFEEFAVASSAHLVRTGFLLTGDAGLAEDLAQDALVGLYVAWPRVSDPYAYARRSIVNAVRTRWRRGRRRREVSLTDLLDDAVPAAADSAPALAARHVLMAALDTLPPRQRAVVVLRHLEDLSEAQTADLLGLSVGTVKSHNARAMAELRDLLAPAGRPDVHLLREGLS